MKINFTKKQYKQLIDLAYLGEWTANSSKTGSDRSEEFGEMLQYILSFAKEFGYDDIVTLDKRSGNYYLTGDYEESLHYLIQENDDDVFWSQLSSRFAEKELLNSGEEFDNPDDRVRRFWEIEEKYEEEFDNNGIKNLVVRGKDKSN
ncbi:hypothetical protein MM300_07250 [Evansella sp. LMS18]|uniref:hypothetical protein n=1 Tax=Evansella sp. LMS18 TaxID=2924033 RepID=UPI0020D17260|nr:hypothetical protein [Evansella sp. LMS18]UTR12081.1 hypothetical protein MM300_07250 [Evansella sp. LMS18]